MWRGTAQLVSSSRQCATSHGELQFWDGEGTTDGAGESGVVAEPSPSRPRFAAWKTQLWSGIWAEVLV